MKKRHIPNAVKSHNPDPKYLRYLVETSCKSQRAAAKQIGISERAMRYYISGERTVPYCVQFALECLTIRR